MTPEELKEMRDHIPQMREANDMAAQELVVARCEQQIPERIDRKVAGAIAATFKDGPIAMAQLDTESVQALLPEKLRTLANAYERSDGSRLITGPTGTGKTLTAVAIGVRLVRARIDRDIAREEKIGNPLRIVLGRIPEKTLHFVWTHARQLSNARKWHPLGQGDARAITEAKAAFLLVIDDMGWEPVGDDVIPEILNDRYEHKRPTLITSGLTPEELKSRYGSAVLRRALGEDGKIINLFAPVRAVK